MTNENIERHIAVEMERARSLRAEADVAANVGLCGRAAGALYFAALHACRALLASKGLEPRSHGGVRALVSLHFVKTSALNAEVVRCLSDLQEAREGSDYLASYTVTREELEVLATSADRVIGDIAALIER